MLFEQKSSKITRELDEDSCKRDILNETLNFSTFDDIFEGSQKLAFFPSFNDAGLAREPDQMSIALRT